jgi:TetR/AcrR family transcriptional regulator, cholesterol catabolism regulator
MAKRRRTQGDADEVVVKRGVLNQARWDEILRAATAEFYEKGFKGARLQDIAGRVGLLTGSLYYYIESKENLLFALVDTAFRKSLDATAEEPSIAGTGAPLRLQRFIERMLHVLEQTEFASVVVVQRDRKFLSTEHRTQVDAMLYQLRNHVSSIIKDGIAHGEFDTDVDVDMATSSLFAMLNSTGEWAGSADPVAYDEISRWYARLLLRALAPPLLLDDE